MVQGGKLKVGIRSMAENSKLNPRKSLPAVIAAHLCEVVRGLFLKAFKQRLGGELLMLQQNGFYTG